ncbi:uncharacterized protein LOC119546427 [Drosophila subpulchrella]|uniref:uncharacterized protein LOC119546427 n=1 Tax=Drosophila subpulchrella TaxID=1486046 RepID=UPI0018A17BEC|nr:uncharacterized protein LOC119546427 [Drosophila subpulchrella]
MEEVQVKDEPQSDDEDLRLEEMEVDIKMEPLMVEPESEEDFSMQDEISVKVECTMLEKVKEEPAFSSSDHTSLAICCIPSCGQKQTSQIRLFGFPRDKILLFPWLVNTQVKPRLVNPAELYVCQQHFVPEAIQGNNLFIWALPTLLLGHEDYIIPNLAQGTEHVMRYICENYCSVPCCFRAKDDGFVLIEYPGDKATRQKWRYRCRHRAEEVDKYGFRLCQAHFPSNCFDPDTGELFAGSLPSRELFPCLVPGCVRDAGTPVVYYRVPQSTAELDAWSHNLLIPPSVLKANNQRICGRHFEDDCFRANKTLLLGSLPTLFLGHHNEILPNPKMVKAQRVTCSVPSCGRIRRRCGLKFVLFPKSQGLIKKWMHNMRLDASIKNVQSLLVCHEHFEKHCFETIGGKRRLRCGSIPTLKLGHSHRDLHESDSDLMPGKTKKKILSWFKKNRFDCCYPWCRWPDKVRAYDLPRTEKLRAAWLKHMNIQEPSAVTKKTLKLCRLHFVILYEHSGKECLDHVPDETLDAYYKEARSKASIVEISCAVKGCDTLRPRDGGTLHNIKMYKELRQMWLENCQITLESLSSCHRVCSKHFEPECFLNGRLLGWSVPTLHLPGKAIHQSITEEQWKIYRQAERLNELGVVEEDVEYLESNPVDGEVPNVIEEQPKDQCLEVVLEVSQGHKRHSRLHTEKILFNPKKCSENRCAVPGCPITFKDVTRTFRLHKLPVSEGAAEMWLHNSQVKIDKEYWPDFRICAHHFEQDCFIGSRLRPGAVPTLSMGSESLELMYDSEWNKKEKKPPSRFPRAVKNC